MNPNTDSKEFWENQYKNNRTGWDLNSATPAFIQLLQNNIVFGKEKGHILVAGSGKGYDAVEAAKNGFLVTAVDITDFAADFSQSLSRQNNVNINILKEDIFLLTDEYKNKFDFIYDYVTYCALNPAKREEYLTCLHKYLKPGGKLILLLFPVERREGGPPYGIDSFETYKLASKFFRLHYFTKNINSIKPRLGREILQVYIKGKDAV